MPKPMPSLSISSPNKKTRIAAGHLPITGTVTAPDMPEPVDIHSVHVQLDEGPPVSATLSHHGNPKLLSFSAAVQFPDDQDHDLTVTVHHSTGAPVQSHLRIGPRSCGGCG